MSISSSKICPSAASTKPEIAISVVVFPAPLAPIRETMLLSGTSNEIPFNAEMCP